MAQRIQAMLALLDPTASIDADAAQVLATRIESFAAQAINFQAARRAIRAADSLAPLPAEQGDDVLSRFDDEDDDLGSDVDEDRKEGEGEGEAHASTGVGEATNPRPAKRARSLLADLHEYIGGVLGLDVCGFEKDLLPPGWTGSNLVMTKAHAERLKVRDRVIATQNIPTREEKRMMRKKNLN